MGLRSGTSQLKKRALVVAFVATAFSFMLLSVIALSNAAFSNARLTRIIWEHHLGGIPIEQLSKLPTNVPCPRIPSLQSTTTVFRATNAKIVFLRDGRFPSTDEEVCELAVIATHNCFIEEGEETFLECLERIGANVMQPLLSTRCTRSIFFEETLLQRYSRLLSPKSIALHRICLRRSRVHGAQVDVGDPLYVPPAKRSIGRYGQPKTCSTGCKVYPISFAVPRENVVSRASRLKVYDFSPMNPRNFPIDYSIPYSFNHNEEALAQTVQELSYFAFTNRRGGWDCMRHYEILSSGAVPYFPDLPLCHQMCLTSLPKTQLLNVLTDSSLQHIGKVVRESPDVTSDFIQCAKGGHVKFRRYGTINRSQFDEGRYFRLADELLDNTLNYMTTDALVAYILKVMHYEEPMHVLLLQDCVFPIDYMQGCLEHGLAMLGIKYRTNCYRDPMYRATSLHPHDVTEADLDAERDLRTKGAHGAGYVLGMRVPEVLDEQLGKPQVRQLLLHRDFDLVIYGFTANWHRRPEDRPFWSEVSAAVSSERIAFFDHRDDHAEDLQMLNAHCSKGFFFVRELHQSDC